jgi:hypothetical protein
MSSIDGAILFVRVYSLKLLFRNIQLFCPDFLGKNSFFFWIKCKNSISWEKNPKFWEKIWFFGEKIGFLIAQYNFFLKKKFQKV